MPQSSLHERLQDPDERFAPQEIYALFEQLAEEYGFHRDPNLPAKGSIAETTSLTLEGYEHLGVVVVRPRTIGDTMVSIPNLVDKLLGANLQPSQASSWNANLIALAKTVIVAPPRLVDSILESADDTNLGFFLAFATEYAKYMKARAEAVKQKKSGATTGNDASSLFERSTV